MSINNRIKEYRLKEGFKIKPFASIVGISQGTLSDIENAKSNPSAETLALLVRNTDINPTWLLTGEGPMERVYRRSGGESQVISEESPIYNEREAVIAEIIEMLKSEPPEVQKLCLRILKNRKEIKEGFRTLMDFNNPMKKEES